MDALRRYRHYGVIVPGVAYLVGTTLWHTAHTQEELRPMLSAAVGMHAARQTIFVLVWLFVVWESRIDWRKFAEAAGPVWAWLTFVGLPPLYNANCNAAFLLCFLPFQRNLLLALFMVLPAFIFQHGLTCVLMLAAMAIVGLSRWFLVLAAIGAWVFRGQLVHQQERIDIARLTLEYMWQVTNPWFGAGFGSYVFYGPLITLPKHYAEQFLSAHNDYVQVLFEHGLVGALLLAGIIFGAYRRLDREWRLSLVALLAFGITYFPMEIPVVLIWGLVIIGRAFKG
jgi:O-antigen ligase